MRYHIYILYQILKLYLIPTKYYETEKRLIIFSYNMKNILKKLIKILYIFNFFYFYFLNKI